jgi:excisionase family DNA binding protein
LSGGWEPATTVAGNLRRLVARNGILADFLTIKEVCALLRLGERTVYDLAREGKLVGAAKIGGQWRVNREKLMAWLEAGGEFEREREDESDT